MSLGRQVFRDVELHKRSRSSGRTLCKTSCLYISPSHTARQRGIFSTIPIDALSQLTASWSILSIHTSLTGERNSRSFSQMVLTPLSRSSLIFHKPASLRGG